MQENPRASLDTIRLLLAQYLDGALDTDRLVEVELLLDRYPVYQQELIKLQEARGILKHALNREQDLHFSKVSDTAWKKIAQQLQQDNQTQLTPCDFEFISAYYDGELDPEDSALSAFEEQLFQNKNANQMLSEIRAVSEVVRRAGYRLEESCTVDLTQQVMQAYQAEQQALVENIENNNSLLEDVIPPHTEILSAFVDQELSAKEVIELNRLIEGNEAVREQLTRFNQISDITRAIGEKIQVQAPHRFWENIEAQLLSEAPLKKYKTLQDRSRSLSWGIFKKVAIPSAAAALLVLLSIPSLRNEGVVSSTSPQVTPLQLASVPLGNTSSAKWLSTSDSIEQESRQLSSAQLSGSRQQLTTQQDWHSVENHTSEAPTSEEYLFRALEESVSENEIFH